MKRLIPAFFTLLLAMTTLCRAACLSCDDIIHLGAAEQACFRTLFRNEGLPDEGGAPRRYDLSGCLDAKQGLDRGGVVTMPDIASQIATTSGRTIAKTVYVLDYPAASCLATILIGMRGRTGTVDLTRLCP